MPVVVGVADPAGSAAGGPARAAAGRGCLPAGRSLHVVQAEGVLHPVELRRSRIATGLDHIEAARQALPRPTYSIAGETDLQELAALIRSATLLLTCDTGPLHIATALGAPTLSLWGRPIQRSTAP